MAVFSAHAETFPAKFTCNTNEKISLAVTGSEQRITYVSSRYGTFHGYLDVFQGQSTENMYEALANIHGTAKYKDNPLTFTFLMKRINGKIDNDSISYQYIYIKNKKIVEEQGHCIPVNKGGFIEGTKNY